MSLGSEHASDAGPSVRAAAVAGRPPVTARVMSPAVNSLLADPGRLGGSQWRTILADDLRVVAQRRDLGWPG